MKSLLLFCCGMLLGAALYGQASTAADGPFAAGDRAVTFTNNGLATPAVDAQLFYPATSAGTGTPIAAGQFPVIAFGHGFNLNYLDYQILCRHYASWGYVVISPDVQNGFNVDHAEYAKELAACLDYVLAEGNASASPLFQHIIDKTGVLGHSMGGGASALVPANYPGIDAVSGLAAAETNPSAIAALSTYTGPYQIISGSSDNTAPENTNQLPMYNAALGPKQFVSITGGAHCKFTDGTTICDLVSSAGSVTRAFQVYMAKKYTTAFFNYYLKADVNALPFLCGDSLAADVQAFRISESHTIDCNAVAITPSTATDWQLYPNPAQHSLRVTGIQGAVLYDARGTRLVVRDFGTAREGEISLAQLPAGIYWLQPTDGGQARAFRKE
jgi:dienelactone hydrolase